MNAIEIQSVTKRYGAKTAVDHLSLTVPEGEFFALLGVNGAGKSTLVKTLCGLTAPSEGDALLLGRSVTKDAAAARSLVGVSPQETAVAPNLSVRENLELMAGVYGLPDGKTRAGAVIEAFKLGEIEKQSARTLSGGWQRRLSIAMALVSDPKILFLDEPTLGLDVIARRELWAHIRRLKGRITIVLTTHYLEEAEALADRIGVMAHGRLVAVGTAEALMAQTGKAKFEDAFIELAGEGGAEI